MTSTQSERSSTLKQWWLLFLLLWAAGLIIALNGCAHVTPVTEERSTVGFTGNDQDGGIRDLLPDGSLEVAPWKRDQYNRYIALYGKKLIPKPPKDFGVAPLENGNYSMTKQAAEVFYALILEAETEKVDGK